MKNSACRMARSGLCGKGLVGGRVSPAFFVIGNYNIISYNVKMLRKDATDKEEFGLKEKRTVLWKIFISTLYLSTFTFGGGYVIVSLMKKKFVDEYHWIDEKEMLDLVAIAQSAPGAIAVNGAIVVGYKLAGIVGAAVAIFGTIIPPFFIISILSVFYQAFRSSYVISQMLEGMQAGVGAVIASVVFDMGVPIAKEKDFWSVFILIGAFIASWILKINVIYIILACTIFGICRTLFVKRRGK